MRKAKKLKVSGDLHLEGEGGDGLDDEQKFARAIGLTVPSKKEGMLPLHYASKFRNVEVLDWLVEEIDDSSLLVTQGSYFFPLTPLFILQFSHLDQRHECCCDVPHALIACR